MSYWLGDWKTAKTENTFLDAVIITLTLSVLGLPNSNKFPTNVFRDSGSPVLLPSKNSRKLSSYVVEECD